MPNKKNYIVSTLKPWNIKVYNDVIKNYEGNWHLITDKNNLTVERILNIAPEYIFFPHWSHIVPNEILDVTTCVNFHETDLPYGRGGSPIQNLIALGHTKTSITALKMSKTLDAGPIYLKKALSLEFGTAEEIFLKAAYIIAEMIKEIITLDLVPAEQIGEPTCFKRRTPEESVITSTHTLNSLYDHIRMLDAEGYPKAFLNFENFKYEISRASLKTDAIIADVRITEVKRD